MANTITIGRMTFTSPESISFSSIQSGQRNSIDRAVDLSGFFVADSVAAAKVLRDELIIQMEKVGASASMGLILNPQTGAILSMVNLPDYNPNSPNDFDIELQRNKIVSDLIEPGSTFKIVTMAAALESDISLTDEYNVQGPYNFHNIKMIEDSEPHTVLNVKEILAFSSNIGTIKIAEYLGKKSIYNQAREFGYGTKTGFDSFTEQPGTFRAVSYTHLTLPTSDLV